jgi:murein hydrolase activator
VQLYKMGRAGYWRLLLDVDSLREIGRVYRTASALTHINRDRIAEHQRTLSALQQERQALEGRAADLAKLHADAAQAQTALNRAVTSRSALVTSIDERRDLNAQLTGELQDAQQKLQASVAQLGAGRGGNVSLPIRPFQGGLPWPGDGVVMVRFGQTPRRGGLPMRNGIEISLREGSPVRAVHEGTVAFAEPFSGYGNLVILDHGDKCFSLYGHLNRVNIHKGDRVDALATVGLAGRNPAGNPSLYFELRIDGKAVDPLQWLKRP